MAGSLSRLPRWCVVGEDGVSVGGVGDGVLVSEQVAVLEIESAG